MNKTIIYTSHSAEETGTIGNDFAQQIDRNIITLTGELGAGKTTFVQGLAQGLKIKRRISSPTFIIMRSYEVPNPYALTPIPYTMFYHVDLYRMETMHDIEALGILDLMKDSTNLFAIEWAEKLGNNLPKKRIDIKIEYVSDEERKLGVIYEN